MKSGEKRELALGLHQLVISKLRQMRFQICRHVDKKILPAKLQEPVKLNPCSMQTGALTIPHSAHK